MINKTVTELSSFRYAPRPLPVARDRSRFERHRTRCPTGSPEVAADKSQERRALGVACGAHVLHDGYTDLVWIALPIWQAEFGLSYAVVGLLRMIYSGTLASLQIPASLVAQRIGGGVVLALGTALSGLCYCIAGISGGFSWLIFALFLGGLGAATQHPIVRRWSPALSPASARSRPSPPTISRVTSQGSLPATATAMILIMPWRPAYGLLGMLGLAAAVAIFMLTPRLTPETPAAALVPAQTASAQTENARMRFGFRILVASVSPTTWCAARSLFACRFC